MSLESMFHWLCYDIVTLKFKVGVEEKYTKNVTLNTCKMAIPACRAMDDAIIVAYIKGIWHQNTQ